MKSATLENILCPAQRAGAVLDLILDTPDRWIQDDTLLYSMYSIQSNVSEILEIVDRMFEKDQRLWTKLCDMGIAEEVANAIKEPEEAPDNRSNNQ